VLSRVRAFLRSSRTARVAITLVVLAVIGYSVFRVGRHLRATSQLHSAREALGRGQVRKAHSILLGCLQVRPDDPEVHFLLGRTARRAGNYKEAEEYLFQAKRLGGVPEEIQLERLLGAVERGDFDAALESQLWAYVEKDHPDALDILDALALGYLVTFRLDLARQAADRLLELQQDFAPAWVVRGKAFYHLRNYADAASSYARAVALSPEDTEARLLLARCLAENSQSIEALQQFDHLLVHSPDDPALLAGRARCLLELGRNDEARTTLDRLVKLAPLNAEVLALRGKLALQELDFAEAEKRLRKAVELDPSHRDAVYNLGRCLQLQDTKEKQEEGAQWVQQFKALDADQVRLSKLMTEVLTAPGDPSARCQAGEIFLKLGIEKEGVRWLQSALNIDPNHAPSHRALRDYYISKGQKERAEMHERALTKG